MNYPEIYTDSTGTFVVSPTGTGLKVKDGGISLDNSTPVAGQLTGATITSPVLTNPSITTATPVNATASTLSLTAATHGGKTVTLNRAAGIAVTLPAATGSGVTFRLVIGTTFTGAASIAVASATDYFVGTIILFADAGDTVLGYATANTGTVATESDTISMFGTANSQGGIKGAVYEIQDIASAVWAVRGVSDAGGTEATPFSVAV